MAKIIVTIDLSNARPDQAVVTDWFGLRKRTFCAVYSETRGLRDWYNRATGDYVGPELRDELNDAWFDTMLRPGPGSIKDSTLDGRSHGL